MRKQPNPILHQDPSVTVIALVQQNGTIHQCQVDTQDYEVIKTFRWSVLSQRTKWRAVTVRNGKFIYMHRQILGLNDSTIQVDHRNGISLDNRRSNLRTCSNGENNRNKGSHRDTQSPYKGVQWHHGKWEARIMVDGVKIRSARYSTALQAAMAYNDLALQYHKEFAQLNNLGAGQ